MTKNEGASAWKSEFLEKGASVFSSKSDTEKQSLEETQEVPFKKIGQQQYEIDRLKKNLKLSDSWRKEK